MTTDKKRLARFELRDGRGRKGSRRTAEGWWKHGQSWETRRDGLLNLDTANAATTSGLSRHLQVICRHSTFSVVRLVSLLRSSYRGFTFIVTVTLTSTLNIRDIGSKHPIPDLSRAHQFPLFNLASYLPQLSSRSLSLHPIARVKRSSNAFQFIVLSVPVAKFDPIQPQHEVPFASGPPGKVGFPIN